MVRWGGQSSFNFWCWSQKCKFCIDIYHGVSCNIKHIMGGVNHLSTFDADLRNVSFAVTSSMGFPALLSTLQPFQMCFHNRKYSKWTFSHDSQLMGNRFMANLHASLESTCKSRISKIPTRCQNWGVNHLSLCPG